MPSLFGINVDGQVIVKVLNSRVGLAVLVGILYNWGLSPKIDALIKANERVAVTVSETHVLTGANHDILTRLMDRCEFPGPAADMRGHTAFANKISE